MNVRSICKGAYVEARLEVFARDKTYGTCVEQGLWYLRKVRLRVACEVQGLEVLERGKA